MDLSKAFDCLPHELLIAKMEAYGFENGSLKLFYNYLKQRKQTVSINGEMSDYMDILAGVPQGSILGPTLFLVMVADMPKFVIDGMPNAKMTGYADDSTVYMRAKSMW